MKSNDYKMLEQALLSNSSEKVDDICRRIIYERLIEDNDFWRKNSQLLHNLLKYNSFYNHDNSVSIQKSFCLWRQLLFVLFTVISTYFVFQIPNIKWLIAVFLATVTSLVFFYVLKQTNNITSSFMNIFNSQKNMASVNEILNSHNTRIKNLQDKIEALTSDIEFVKRAYKDLSLLIEINNKTNSEVADLRASLDEKNKEISGINKNLEELKSIKNNYESVLKKFLEDYSRSRAYNDDVRCIYSNMMKKLTSSTHYRFLFYENNPDHLQFFETLELNGISEIEETPAIVFIDSDGTKHAVQLGTLHFPAKNELEG